MCFWSWSSGNGPTVVTVGSGEGPPGLKPGLQLLGQLFLPWFAEPVPPSIRPGVFGDLCLVPCELPEPGTLTARRPHQTSWAGPSLHPEDSLAAGAERGPPGDQVRTTHTPELSSIPCGALALLILGVNSPPDWASPGLRPGPLGWELGFPRTLHVCFLLRPTEAQFLWWGKQQSSGFQLFVGGFSGAGSESGAREMGAITGVSTPLLPQRKNTPPTRLPRLVVISWGGNYSGAQTPRTCSVGGDSPLPEL